MSREQFEAQFLDYLEQRLDASARKAFEDALQQDAELKLSLEGYRSVISGERELRSESRKLSPNFDVRVMQRIEAESTGFFRRFLMQLAESKRYVAGSVALCAVLLVAIQLTREPIRFNSATREAFVDQTVPAAQDEKKLVPEPELTANIAREIAQPQSLAEGAVAPLPSAVTVMHDKVEADASQLLRKDAAKTANQAIGGRAESRLNNLGFSNAIASVDGAWAPPMPRERQLSPYRSAPPADDIVILQEQNRELYKAWGENPRVSPKQQPISTFSIDVDTGSYTNARRFLRSGTLPPADSVRIEEFVNYFDYAYPAQLDRPFSLSYELAPSPLEPDRLLLKLGIKAKEITQSDKPWNLVFLVDVSGSMSDEDKLPLVKKSLKLLAGKMREQDRIAIVTYAGSTGVALESTGKAEQSKILAAIEGLGAGGSTNGSGGINAAYDVAQRTFIKSAVNRVILATDGDFNVGVTSIDDLIKLIEEKRKSGVTLTTLGFGQGNIQEATMEQLANKGNGNFFYIDSFDEARKVFETDLAGTIEVVAKDVKLQIDFNPAHVAQYRLIGYENRKLENEDFNNDKIDAGEIGAGHTVTALYELVLADSALAKSLAVESRYPQGEKPAVEPAAAQFAGELAFLKVRFKQPEGETSELLTFPIERSAVKQSVSEASVDFRFAAAVSYFGHLLRSSKFVGSYTFADVEKLAEGALGADAHGYRRQFVELVKNARAGSGR